LFFSFKHQRIESSRFYLIDNILFWVTKFQIFGVLIFVRYFFLYTIKPSIYIIFIFQNEYTSFLINSIYRKNCCKFQSPWQRFFFLVFVYAEKTSKYKFEKKFTKFRSRSNLSKYIKSSHARHYIIFWYALHFYILVIIYLIFF